MRGIKSWVETDDLNILHHVFLRSNVNVLMKWSVFLKIFLTATWIFTEQLTVFVLPLIYYERFYSFSDTHTLSVCPEDDWVKMWKFPSESCFPYSSLNGGSLGVTILIKLLALTSNKFYVPHKTCELTLRRRSEMCIVVGSEHPLSDQGPLN